ncbi:unnamed protein product [Urochloa humidicola]
MTKFKLANPVYNYFPCSEIISLRCQYTDIGHNTGAIFASASGYGDRQTYHVQPSTARHVFIQNSVETTTVATMNG